MGELDDRIENLLSTVNLDPKPTPYEKQKQKKAEAKFQEELRKKKNKKSRKAYKKNYKPTGNPVGRPRGRAKRTISGKGYSYVWVDGKQVTEQRYLMEQKLQRKLLPHEAVFFIDGDKTNLSLDNLKLGPKPGYKGDIICPNCNCNVYQ